MYLRDALSRCRDLAEEVSNIYTELASQHAGRPELAETWNQIACDEHAHSHQLGALLAIHDALDEDGPFLVGLDRRSKECSQWVRACYTRVREGIAPDEALELCNQLENSQLDVLLTEMLDLAKPAVKRLTEKLYKRAKNPVSHRRKIERLRKLAEVVHQSREQTGAAVAGNGAALS
jgi:hypothetical protein